MAAIQGLGHVPHYDVHGHQHGARPFKDKSRLLAEEVPYPRWFDPAPAMCSHYELQQSKSRGSLPGGHTGQHHDHSSTGRGGAASSSPPSYPPHFNAHHVPAHATRTELQLDRRAEARGIGVAVGERYAAASAPVPEPQLPTAQTAPRVCPISHISERVEARVQASRTRGGLLAQTQPVNPERESREIGLGHAQEPAFATRGQLLEARREGMKRECEELRARGDEVNVPNSVRKARTYAEEFEFRRPGEAMTMTMTQVRARRRQDKVEYDMRNFSCPSGPEYPRFSERPDVPFWQQGAEGTMAAAAGPPRAAAMSRTLSEPALKVTEIPFGDDSDGRGQQRGAPLPPAAAAAVAAAKAGCQNFGSNTVKRWSADMLDRGQGRNKPRLFDSIQQVQVGPRDLESLDHTSSMEPIRSAALRQHMEERRQNAVNPRRSRLWFDASQQPSVSADGHHGSSMDLGDDAPAGIAVDRGFLAGGGGGGGSLPPRGGQRRDSAARLAGAAAVVLDKTTESAREPRFFGSSARPDATGVRCGGFQRLDWPPRHSRAPPPPAVPQQQQQQPRGSRAGGEHSSKERPRLEQREGAAPAASAAVAMAQPL
mmetsp:Transcript_80656/g.228467  ORF Transcript_80656/g.228467 Transcript_80656/m.228467 type:complete len:598 (+) Transcript_80656:86-1879(+)